MTTTDGTENPQFESSEDETSSNERTSSNEEELSKDGQQSVKVETLDENVVEESPRDRYWNNVRRIVSLLPCSLDHISDILVMVQLYRMNSSLFFGIALFIDLLPGPIAVYQFALLGYGWKSLVLIFHPINAYLHTALLVTGSKYGGKFSEKVVAYSHDCQGLLESPIQAIYTLTLIALGFLPTPLENSSDNSWVIKNSFGQEISVSFWPALSVALSFLSIIINSARAIDLFQSGSKQILSWLLFLTSTIFFRIEIWVLLCSFLAEYVLIIVLIIFIINFATLLKLQRDIKVDPFLASIHSLVIPVTHLKSILPAEGIHLDLKPFKMMYKVLTIAGSFVLIVALYCVTFLVKQNKMQQYPLIRIRRDHFDAAIICTCILCLFSIVSTYILSSQEIQKFFPSKFVVTPPSRIHKIYSVSVRIFLISFVFIVFASQFGVHREEKKVEFRINITDVCGHVANYTFKGYTRGGINHGQLVNPFIRKCPTNGAEGGRNPLGCLNGNLTILNDLRPASPLIGYSSIDPLLLIMTDKKTDIENLTEDVTKYCGIEKRIVCYFTYYSVYSFYGFKTRHIDPSLCTHIMFVYNTLNEETLLHQKADKDQDVDGLFKELTSMRSGRTKIILSVGGPGHKDELFSKLVQNQTLRRNFVQHSTNYLLQYNFDGMNIFWNSPVVWSTGDKNETGDKAGFQMLVQELRKSFRPHFSLSMEISPKQNIIEQAYNLTEISKYLDFISIISWKLNNNDDNSTTFGMPLKSPQAQPCSSIDCTINYLISDLNIDKAKLVIGLQFHAVTYTLLNASDHGLGAQINMTNKAGAYSNRACRAGRQPYFEVCNNVLRNGWKLEHVPNQGSYAYKDDQWAAFNDVIDIEEKAKYVEDEKLGGVLVFVLDYDDFQNECQCEKYPLLNAINRVFDNEKENSGKNCSLFAIPNERSNVTFTNRIDKSVSKCPA